MKIKKLVWILFFCALIGFSYLVILGISQNIRSVGYGIDPATGKKLPFFTFANIIIWLSLGLFLTIRRLRALYSTPQVGHAALEANAGIFLRAKALLIDAIVLSPIILPPYLFEAWNTSFYLLVFSLTQLLFLYDVFFDRITGQTLGKKIMGIKVESMTGQSLTWRQAWLRSVPYWPIALLNLSLVFGSDYSYSVIWPVTHQKISDAFENAIPLLVFSSNLTLAITTIDICFMCLRKDRRALHDLVGGVQVVMVAPPENLHNGS